MRHKERMTRMASRGGRSMGWMDPSAAGPSGRGETRAETPNTRPRTVIPQNSNS